MGEVEDTASAVGSTAVSPATDSAGRVDLVVEVFLVGEIMAASVIVVFATLMGASSAMDIRTITRCIIPTIIRILSTEIIWGTNWFR